MIRSKALVGNKQGFFISIVKSPLPTINVQDVFPNIWKASLRNSPLQAHIWVEMQPPHQVHTTLDKAKAGLLIYIEIGLNPIYGKRIAVAY